MDGGVTSEDVIPRLVFALSNQVSCAVDSAGRDVIERAHEPIFGLIRVFSNTHRAVESGVGGSSTILLLLDNTAAAAAARERCYGGSRRTG